MSALAERNNVVPFKASPRVSAYKLQVQKAHRRYRGEGCKMAGMILLGDPESISDRLMIDFVREIEHVDDDRALAWLAQARVNGLVKGGSLDVAARSRLANVLKDYWKKTLEERPA